MSDVNRIINGCWSKVQYKHREQAERNGTRGYKCPFCSTWHATSQIINVVSYDAFTTDNEGLVTRAPKDLNNA